MDQNEQKVAHEFNNKCSLTFNSIKLQVHLLLGMALLFSFLFTFTSYNSYHYHLSAFSLPLFTHTFEKKYLFLLCTTILTFITKNNPHLALKENIYYSLPDMGGAPAPVLEGYTQEFEYCKSDEQESKEEFEKNPENNEKESEVLVEDEDEDDDEGVLEEEGFLGGFSSVEEEHAEINMDTEEFNQKIEEFIRKMREELRVDAEKHLIRV